MNSDEELEVQVYDTAAAYLEEGYYSVQELKDIIKTMEEENKKFRKAMEWAEQKTRRMK